MKTINLVYSPENMKKVVKIQIDSLVQAAMGLTSENNLDALNDARDQVIQARAVIENAIFRLKYPKTAELPNYAGTHPEAQISPTGRWTLQNGERVEEVEKTQ